MWEGLDPPYGAIVADPPWAYPAGWPSFENGNHGGDRPGRRGMAYSALTLAEVAALPVRDLADETAHCYLWTTNQYLPESFALLDGWGFSYSTTLVWAKTPMGVGPGGCFSITTEFVVFGYRGCARHSDRIPTTWWNWTRGKHSEKPPAFLDVVEAVSPGPYVELFARAPRLGWDHWGHGYEIGVA